MLVTLASFSNALAHVFAVMWGAIFGEGNLSLFAGPFTQEGQQIQNLMATPFIFVWLFYTTYVMGSKDDNYKFQRQNWRRFLFPVILLILGWLMDNVYPRFFRKNQFEWPFLFGK